MTGGWKSLEDLHNCTLKRRITKILRYWWFTLVMFTIISLDGTDTPHRFRTLTEILIKSLISKYLDNNNMVVDGNDLKVVSWRRITNTYANYDGDLYGST